MAIWRAPDSLVVALLCIGGLASCADPTDAPSADPCAGLTSGAICTVAGEGTKGFSGDDGPATKAWLWTPWDVTTDEGGLVYLSDWNNHRIRRVDHSGRIATIIGTDTPGDGDPEAGEFQPGGADALTVSLNHPTDMLFAKLDTPVARKGQLLLTAWHNHRLRAWDPTTGRISVTCGKAPGYNGDGQPMGKQTALNQPSHSVQNAQGDTFILDMRNWLVREVSAAGQVAKVAGSWAKPGGVTDDGPTDAKTAQFLFFDPSEWSNPYFAGGGIAVSPDGEALYVADTFNHRIRKIHLGAATIETVAGSGPSGCLDAGGQPASCKNDLNNHPTPGAFGGDGGPAKLARLNLPTDLAFGPDGRLYFADSGNDRVRAVDLDTGIVTTVAGGGKGGTTGNVMKPLTSAQIGDRGPATQATLNRPRGIHIDSAGNLWIADSYNNRIRKVLK